MSHVYSFIDFRVAKHEADTAPNLAEPFMVPNTYTVVFAQRYPNIFVRLFSLIRYCHIPTETQTAMALVQHASPSLCSLLTTPGDSPFCARCMLGATTKGLKREEGANGKKFFWENFVKDLKFRGSLVRFLFTARTRDQTQQFLDNLDHCSCEMSDSRTRQYHQIGRTMQEAISDHVGVDICSPAIAFIINLFRTLSVVLESANIKSVAKRVATKRWPTCPEDLMPFGPQNLIKSFIVWSSFLPDAMVFLVAAQCIRFCGSLLIPYATESGLTRHAVDSGRQLFDRTWSAIRLRAATKRKLIGKAFMYQLQSFLCYFNWTYARQSLDERVLMLSGYEVKALQMSCLLTHVAADPRLFLESNSDVQMKAALARQTAQIYSYLAMYISPLPSVLLPLETFEMVLTGPSADSMEVSSDPSDIMSALSSGLPPTLTKYSREDEYDLFNLFSQIVVRYLRSVRYDLRCAGPGCSSSIHSAGRAFQRCGGCSVAAYCSKKCQVDAWKTGKFPHKEICKIIRKLVPIAGRELIFGVADLLEDRLGDKLVSRVVDKWYQEKVPLSDIYNVAASSSEYDKTDSSSRAVRSSCDPGYDDYKEKLAEMCERDGALQSQYVDMEVVSRRQTPKVDDKVDHLGTSTPGGKKGLKNLECL